MTTKSINGLDILRIIGFIFGKHLETDKPIKHGIMVVNKFNTSLLKGIVIFAAEVKTRPSV
jgi:hypothetical protein